MAQSMPVEVRLFVPFHESTMLRSPHAPYAALLFRSAMLAALTAAVACGGDSGSDGDTVVAAIPKAGGAPGAAGTSGTPATTGNADQDFLRMMSDHHQGMIALARPTKGRFGAGEAARADAGALDTKQTAELDSMTAMLKQAFNDAYLSKVLPNHQAMSDSLAKLSGPVFDRQFYESVIQHHQEGIRMLDQYLRKLTRPEIKAMAERMRDEHKREISELERKRDAIK